jgi:hypothetical protein
VRLYNKEEGQGTTVQGLPVRQLLTSGGRSLLASAVMAGAILLGLELLPDGSAVFGIPLGWVAAVAGAGLGVLVYALASYLVGGAEIRQLTALARRRAQT